MFRNRLLLAAAVLGGTLFLGSMVQAAPPVRPMPRPPVVVNRPALPNPAPNNRMPGWDWWRTYPYSPYNAWRNPYWYYPYTPYVVPPYYYYGAGYYNGVSTYSNDGNLPPVPMPAAPAVPAVP